MGGGGGGRLLALSGNSSVNCVCYSVVLGLGSEIFEGDNSEKVRVARAEGVEGGGELDLNSIFITKLYVFKLVR